MATTRLVLLVFLTLSWTFSAADTEVTCVFRENCTLPCEFKSSSDVFIHWVQLAGDKWVHYYTGGQDQLEYQDQSFKGRTSLFKDQISRGNASLLLTGVKIQDRGRYSCSIGTAQKIDQTFIDVKVNVPIQRIHIHQVEDRITCSSEGIYPEPELTWTTIPPSYRTLQPRTRVHLTEEQLYSISSSLMVPDEGSDLTYSCTIRTSNSSMMSSLRHQKVLHNDEVLYGLEISLLLVSALGAAAAHVLAAVAWFICLIEIDPSNSEIRSFIILCFPVYIIIVATGCYDWLEDIVENQQSNSEANSQNAEELNRL